MARLTLSDLTDSERNHVATCVHEAGHAVLAVLAGATVTQCYARPDGDGRAEYFGHDPQREAGIAWAGPYAEALFIYDGQPSADVLNDYLTNASLEDAEALRGRRGWTVESDVRSAMPAIRRLAARLYAQGFVTNTEVRAALGVRPGMDIDMVRWAYRNRIAPESITLPGSAA
ncbi:M50 family metallopeptidase [Nocardia sp. NPDC047654]|uniref:M50 family metallopeptidase n=1 Tax=Nocardia sp. NPDC047654 TaxID=3364314 RepID=UPI00371291E7